MFLFFKSRMAYGARQLDFFFCNLDFRGRHIVLPSKTVMHAEPAALTTRELGSLNTRIILSHAVLGFDLGSQQRRSFRLLPLECLRVGLVTCHRNL